jgi:putative tricarboxylic transport membrane protein
MADIVLAIAVILGSLVYLYSDFHLPSMVMSDPVGLRVFPAIIGIGLLLSGAALLMQARRVRPVGVSGVAREPQHFAVLLGFAACTALYYAAFEPIGYLPATVIYIFVLLSYFHRNRWKSNVAIALGFAIFAQLLFGYVLGVVLPTGLMPSL